MFNKLALAALLGLFATATFAEGEKQDNHSAAHKDEKAKDATTTTTTTTKTEEVTKEGNPDNAAGSSEARNANK